MKPLIGISCSYDQREGRYFLPEAYVEAVLAAGGIPVILQGAGSIKQAAPYIRAVNGLILAGGGDVDPSYFNEASRLLLKAFVTEAGKRFKGKLKKIFKHSMEETNSGQCLF